MKEKTPALTSEQGGGPKTKKRRRKRAADELKRIKLQLKKKNQKGKPKSNGY